LLAFGVAVMGTAGLVRYVIRMVSNNGCVLGSVRNETDRGRTNATDPCLTTIGGEYGGANSRSSSASGIAATRMGEASIGEGTVVVART